MLFLQFNLLCSLDALRFSCSFMGFNECLESRVKAREQWDNMGTKQVPQIKKSLFGESLDVVLMLCSKALRYLHFIRWWGEMVNIQYTFENSFLPFEINDSSLTPFCEMLLLIILPINQ